LNSQLLHEQLSVGFMLVGTPRSHDMQLVPSDAQRKGALSVNARIVIPLATSTHLITVMLLFLPVRFALKADPTVISPHPSRTTHYLPNTCHQTPPSSLHTHIRHFSFAYPLVQGRRTSTKDAAFAHHSMQTPLSLSHLISKSNLVGNQGMAHLQRAPPSQHGSFYMNACVNTSGQSTSTQARNLIPDDQISELCLTNYPDSNQRAIAGVPAPRVRSDEHLHCSGHVIASWVQTIDGDLSENLAQV
jgi:hypothetical protein